MNSSLSFLEPLDQNEEFYKKYYEYKNDSLKLKELLLACDNYKVYRLPEVYPDVAFFKKITIPDIIYPDDISIRKHGRFGPMFLHNHSFFELNYILKGTAENTIDGKLIKMSEGDICFIPPGTYHTLGVFDESIVINFIIKRTFPDESFMSELPPDNIISDFFLLKQCISLNTDTFLLFHTLHNVPIRFLLDMLIVEGFNDNNKYVKKTLFLSFLNYLIQNRNAKENLLIQDRTKSILKYMEENFSTASLASVAAHFDISEPYLSKFIKETTGNSFVKILQNLKLREACYLLATTDIKLLDVPGFSGYASEVYFNRIFTKRMGITPYKYRKMHKKNM